MAVGALIFLLMWTTATRRGVNLREVFSSLPATGEEEEAELAVAAAVED